MSKPFPSYVEVVKIVSVFQWFSVASGFLKTRKPASGDTETGHYFNILLVDSDRMFLSRY